MFVARHAGNYFARPFLPHSSNHLRDARSLDIDAKRVCIWCWHTRRQLVVETEGHVVLECPHYDEPRNAFLRALTYSVRRDIDKLNCSEAKLQALITQTCPDVWNNFGRFVASIRQRRRLLRTMFSQRTDCVAKNSFVVRREEWRKLGKRVCRHGVFFRSGFDSECTCLRSAVQPMARYMPMLDHDLKLLTITTYDHSTLKRLGQLQAEMRRLNYT